MMQIPKDMTMGSFKLDDETFQLDWMGYSIGHTEDKEEAKKLAKYFNEFLRRLDATIGIDASNFSSAIQLFIAQSVDGATSPPLVEE